MSEEKKRVDFNAPTSLVKRTDSITEVLDTTRTSFIIEALEDEIEDLKKDEDFRQKVTEAYYDDRIEHKVVEDILGHEEAMRVKLLKESIDRKPPEPKLKDTPPDEEFYDGEVPGWIPEEESTSNDESPNRG